MPETYITSEGPQLPATSSNKMVDRGGIIGQIVEFDGTKSIAKVALDLTIEQTTQYGNLLESNGLISFSAINCQESRNQWVFQPYNHLSATFNPANTPIYNKYQEQSYGLQDLVSHAPYMTYSIFFGQSGVYDLFGYGCVESGALYWSFDDDITDLRIISLGSLDYPNLPFWTKVASVYVSEPGIHNFGLYLSDKDKTCILDQWAFVYNEVEEAYFPEGYLPNIFESHREPLDTVAAGPFTVALRLRSLTGDMPYDLTNEQPSDTTVTSWLSSVSTPVSGNYQFILRNSSASLGVEFVDGLCMDFWQIDGNHSNYASWNYTFTTTGVGRTYISSDFGRTITV